MLVNLVAFIDLAVDYQIGNGYQLIDDQACDEGIKDPAEGAMRVDHIKWNVLRSIGIIMVVHLLDVVCQGIDGDLLEVALGHPLESGLKSESHGVGTGYRPHVCNVLSLFLS